MWTNGEAGVHVWSVEDEATARSCLSNEHFRGGGPLIRDPVKAGDCYFPS